MTAGLRTCLASLPRLLRCAAGMAIVISFLGFAVPRTGDSPAESPQEIELAVECGSRVVVDHRRSQFPMRFVSASAAPRARWSEQPSPSNPGHGLPSALLTPLRC